MIGRFMQALYDLRDRRSASRRPLAIPAWIQGEHPPRKCTLLEVSDGGACVQLEDSEAVPLRFTVLRSPSATAGARCEVVWRRESKVGVKFIPETEYLRRTPAVELETQN